MTYEEFERLAKLFYEETGIWPPGKDWPAAGGPLNETFEERLAAFREWLETHEERETGL